MNPKKYLKAKIRNLIRGNDFPLMHGMEPVYQQIVQRDLHRLGIRDDFYPLAGAANYSLFYLIIRIVTQLPVKTVVDLGAGESTRLLDAIKRSGRPLNIFTVEHDDQWAKQISSVVGHEIIKLELASNKINGISFRGYDFTSVRDIGPIDLLIIDGPPAQHESNRFSRLGAVDLAGKLSKNFVVLIDDAERAGEMALADNMEFALQRQKFSYKRGQVITSKRQIILAGGDFQTAAHF